MCGDVAGYVTHRGYWQLTYSTDCGKQSYYCAFLRDAEFGRNRLRDEAQMPIGHLSRVHMILSRILSASEIVTTSRRLREWLGVAALQPC